MPTQSWLRRVLLAVEALVAGPGTAVQPNPDLLNANANMQVGDVYVSVANPVSVDAALQVGGADVSGVNPVPIDDTWEMIQQAVAEYDGPWSVRCMRQDGVGKAIEYATALGCKQVNCLAGLAPEGVAPEKQVVSTGATS